MELVLDSFPGFNVEPVQRMLAIRTYLDCFARLKRVLLGQADRAADNQLSVMMADMDQLFRSKDLNHFYIYGQAGCM